jgi:hypothetical protein
MALSDRFLYFSQKISERLTIIHGTIRDGGKISDNDYDVLEAIFSLYEDGKIDWLNKEIRRNYTVTQNDLFNERRK